jgi:methyltransferase (TIGR00027 family)
MKQGKPSRTAEGVAAFKAAESMKLERDRVYYDPLAKHFLSRLYGTLGKSRLLTRIALWYYERMAPGQYGYIITRTRYVDDYLKTRINDGIEQLVIMGAGYDSRAYIFEGLKGRIKVFEVDHPATQKRKIEKLREIFGSLPPHVVFVPVDFNTEKLDKKLLQSGYNKTLKTLFIWEGMTMYLTAEAVNETLAFIAANSGVGSSLIFNYMDNSFASSPSGQKETKRLRKTAQRGGEPLTFGIEAETIEEFLSNRGFCQVVNVTGDRLKDIYFKGKNQNRTVSRLFPIVHATVKPRG